MLWFMRQWLVTVLLLAVGSAATAQPESSAATCHVAAGSPEVSDAGEIVRPEPSEQQCAAALALEAKFLATNPRDFRIVRNLAQLPRPMQLYVAALGGLGEPRGAVSVQVGPRRQTQPRIAVWSATDLVVLAYGVSDFGGNATTVVLADVDSFTVCDYLRWHTGGSPAGLTIDEIHDALNRGHAGPREAPDCRLRLLPLD